jgi:hypothetical protein
MRSLGWREEEEERCDHTRHCDGTQVAPSLENRRPSRLNTELGDGDGRSAGRQVGRQMMTLLTAHLQHAPPGSEAQGRAGNSALGSLMARRADQLMRIYGMMWLMEPTTTPTPQLTLPFPLSFHDYLL